MPNSMNYQITAQFQQVLDLLSVGTPALVFVTGSAGTGKSTLIEVLRAELDQHLVLVRVVCGAIEGASDALNSEIREILGLHFPISSFDLDLADLHKQVSSLPPVEIAEAYIKDGGILHIKVDEKTPALLLKKEIGFNVLNERGEYIRSLNSRENFSNLPLITGEGAENAASQATAIFKSIYSKLDRVRGLVFVGQRRWNIIMKSGQLVMLPENDPEQAIQKILLLDKTEKILSRKIAVFDFRLPSRITLRVSSDKYRQINPEVIGVRN